MAELEFTPGRSDSAESESTTSGSCYASSSSTSASSSLFEETQGINANGLESETGDQGANLCPTLPAQLKKRRCVGGSGKFKTNWNLPPHIVRSRRGIKFAKCTLCRSDFSVSHGGFNDITRHVNGIVHIEKLREAQSSPSATTFFEGSPPSISTQVMSAELALAQFIALHNLPFQAADHLSALLPVMFPDSKVAKGFACRHTKTKALICNALDPYMKDPIITLLQSSPINLLCDESNERGGSAKLLTVLVRVYDPERSIIATRHLDTVSITDLSAEGIFTALKGTLEQYNIPFNNLLSFTSDTCSVMKGTRGGVIAKLRMLQKKIIDIHCICHLMSLCVKAAVKALPLKVEEVLVDIFYHFRNSVKRTSSLHEYAQFCSIEYKSVLSHCETRWLSLRRALVRTLEMWAPLCSYFRSHSDVEKPGKVQTIDRVLQDPFTKPWFCFLLCVLAVFDKYNVYFQTSSTATIHKLQGECERLLKTVLSFFIKGSEISLASDLTAVDYTTSANHLPEHDIYIGDEAFALITDLRDNEGESVKPFYERVVLFYEKFVTKLLKVFNFKSQTLNSLSFLDPARSQHESPSAFDKVEDNVSISFDKSAVKLEYREFSLDGEVTNLIEVHQDAVQFWLHIRNMTSPMGSLKYLALATLALNLLAIPASNADSERVFSLVRRIKTEFRSSLATETVSSLITCHFNNMSQCCENVKFSEALLCKAKKCTWQRNLAYVNK